MNNWNSLHQTVTDDNSVPVFKKRLIHPETPGWIYLWTDILKVLGQIRGLSPGMAVQGKLPGKSYSKTDGVDSPDLALVGRDLPYVDADDAGLHTAVQYASNSDSCPT